MGYIAVDKTQGEGTAVAIAGSHFDANVHYGAQVVLNNGSAVEIRNEIKDILIAEIRVSNDVEEAEEIKFGDGSKDNKRYHIELISKVLASSELCTEPDLSGKIQVVDKNREQIDLPNDPNNQYYPVEYPLSFVFDTDKKECVVKIKDTEVVPNVEKENFIVSNLSIGSLLERIIILYDVHNIEVDLNNIAVAYGGLGNLIEVEINGAKEYVPIEPLGVIVLAIDGLRQDVLYPDKLDGDDFENVNDPDGNLYYVDASTLEGLGQILKGDPTDSSTQQYIMLPEVTAIFPSITYASWASILTGKLPNETGILGNEFFARDRYNSTGINSIPGMHESGIPSGMVTLSNGAFSTGAGFFGHLKELDFVLGYVTPAEFQPYSRDTLTKKFDASAPGDVLLTVPLWWDINNLVDTGFQNAPDKDTKCHESIYECRTVSMFNQYAVVADWWGTPGLSRPNAFDVVKTWADAAKVMDMIATNETVGFINNYFSKNNPDGKRKRFPAVFSVYLSGLDHEAHGDEKGGGMGKYKSFFMDTTDPQIRDIADALKQQDEFDSKIFVIVADHGHTAMPWDYKVEITNPATGQVKSVTPDTSCELKIEKFDTFKVQAPELANNNLHIWELGEVMKQLNKLYSEIYPGTDIPQKLGYKILAPAQIAEIFKNTSFGAKSSLYEANVIGALNGPMAHVYLKDRTGNNWKIQGRIVEDIGYLSEVLRLLLSKDKTSSNLTDMFPSGFVEYVLFDTIGLRQEMAYSVDAILVRKSIAAGEKYCVFRGIKPDKSDIDCESLKSYFAGNDYVKAVERINGVENQDRSGDIILIMNDKTSGNANDRYTTGTACKSWHGSLNPSDSYVPLIVSYPGGNKYEIEPMINADGVCPNEQCEGNWKLTDIVKEIVKKQYQ